MINQSLSALGMVIKQLSEAAVKRKRNTSEVVPFRASKLTFLLKESLWKSHFSEAPNVHLKTSTSQGVKLAFSKVGFERVANRVS